MNSWTRRQFLIRTGTGVAALQALDTSLDADAAEIKLAAQGDFELMPGAMSLAALPEGQRLKLLNRFIGDVRAWKAEDPAETIIFAVKNPALDPNNTSFYALARTGDDAHRHDGDGQRRWRAAGRLPRRHSGRPCHGVAGAGRLGFAGGSLSCQVAVSTAGSTTGRRRRRSDDASSDRSAGKSSEGTHGKSERAARSAACGVRQRALARCDGARRAWHQQCGKATG